MIDSTLRYAEITGYYRNTTINYNSLGVLLLKKNDPKAALEAFRKAMYAAEQSGDPYQIAIAKEGMARYYIDTKQYQKAVDLLEETHSYSRSIDNLEMEEIQLIIYAAALRGNGDYKTANEMLGRLVTVKDSMTSREKIRSVEIAETKFKVRNKELENTQLRLAADKQEATIKLQKTTLISTGIVALLLGVLAFVIYRRSMDRKRSNEILQTKNERINLLHKELNHRVKNNLAFISGLLRMQGRRLESSEAKSAIQQGEARVEAIALAHRKFYSQQRDTSTNLQEYMLELISHLKLSFSEEDDGVNFELETSEIEAREEAVTALGLITNELVTNSFKHAFPAEGDPRIKIKLTATEDTVTLNYQDKGKGFSGQESHRETTSFGMKLISILTRQLEGNYIQHNAKGASFTFTFPSHKIIA